MNEIPHELALGDVYLSPLLPVFTVALLGAWMSTIVLNKLRHEMSTQPMASLAKSSAAVQKVLAGQSGILTDELDYRGESVLAATRFLPDLKWGSLTLEWENKAMPFRIASNTRTAMGVGPKENIRQILNSIDPNISTG